MISLQDFFRKPEKTAFALSPDGNYLAFMMPYQNRLNVFVQLANSTAEVQRLTNSTERDIAGFFWKGDTRIIFSQDKGGDENFHLFGVDIDGSNLRELTPFEGVKVDVVDELPDWDNELLIAMNKDKPELLDVYRLQIHTGELQKVAQNPGNIGGWLSDHEGKLRVAVAIDGTNQQLLYRPTESDAWELLETTSYRETLSPLMFTPDNKDIYVASNIGRDTIAIVRYDLTKRSLAETLYEHPQVDVEGNISYSRKEKKIRAFAYTTDKTHIHFVDAAFEKQYQAVKAQLPNYEVALLGGNKDENKFLVAAFSDKHRGTYYLYDTNIQQLNKLADLSPWIDEKQMCAMQPISYTSRDGLTIHGYLTLPNHTPPQNLPIVVNPHGGPEARDRWGYNPEVQFLANRGYAVLQVNYRGSIGYGRKFWEAHFKQWGRAMQDDITDGVQWLIEKGIADPKRIAIYGASYGGYASLAGLTFTPDLYACGVSYVGVSNMFTFFESFPAYWRPVLEMYYEKWGHPVHDKELLESISPYYNAHKIKAPLFVAQGARDPRVKKAESDQIVEALQKRGVEVQYMVKENEGHGFRNQENAFEFYEALENFLAQHLTPTDGLSAIVATTKPICSEGLAV